MKANHFLKLTNILKDYDYVTYDKGIRTYLYDYAVKIKNPIVLKSVGTALVAFACNSLTKFKEVMFDYSNDIEDILKKQYSLTRIDDYFNHDIDILQKTKSYRIKSLTPEAAQHIINRNILAINKLNEYIVEQNMLEELGCTNG